jgi:hypothetical protein
VGLFQELFESGRYDSVRQRYMKMDRQTRGREIRKLMAASDYMLGSVHAITEAGDAVVTSASSSQAGPYDSGAGSTLPTGSGIGTGETPRKPRGTEVHQGLTRLRAPFFEVDSFPRLQQEVPRAQKEIVYAQDRRDAAAQGRGHEQPRQNTCGQSSTRERWASSMSRPPPVSDPAPGPHAGAQRRPGWRVPPAGTPAFMHTSDG